MFCHHDTVNVKKTAGWFGKARLKRSAAIVLCAALLVNTIPMDALAAYNTALPSAEEQPDVEAAPDEIPGGQLPCNYTSVSMSDPGLMSDLMMQAPSIASTEEKLELNMQWPQGYDNGTLTLTSGQMAFKIMPGLSGTTVNAPVLEIHIPSCMEVTDYPDETTAQLAPYLAPSNPVTKGKDGSGNTVLTYRFVSKLAWANFSINARIPQGSQVNDNETYSIKLNYYDDTPSNPVLQREVTFTTKKPNVNPPEPGSVWLTDSAMSASRILEEGTTTYDVGTYDWSIGASNRHLPYESLKMIVPLPSGALPVFNDGFSHTPFRDGETKTLTSYRVTYHSNDSYRSEDGSISGSGGVLIYELTAGSSFLTSGTSFSFSSYYQDNIYLRFTNPSVGTYQSTATPRIECVVDGKTIVMRDYDKNSQYLTWVTFRERSEWSTVRPNEKWKDTIFLKDSVSVYDTAAYVRSVYAYPPEHVSYDALSMTVLLPEGALPGTGRGDSFTTLPENTPYDNGSYQVTYRPNYNYSNTDGSVSGTANALVYEIKSSADFLSSSSMETTFTFSGNQQLYLRFTDPKAGVYQSPASPKVEVTRNGKTNITYDFTSSDNSYYTVVTVLEPSDSETVYPDFEENKGRGWSDTIAMEQNQTVYDTKLYDRAVYSLATSIPHYPYDLVRMIVLLPDEAVPGFGTGDAFVPLNNGETYTRSTSYSVGNTWKVTYQEQYSYSNEDKTVIGTTKALIYELASDYSKTTFLKGSLHKDFFTFRTYSDSSGLHLRFTNPKPGIYHSAASPRVEYMMDGRLYVTPGYFSQTEADTSVTFKSPEIDWTKLFPTADANETPLGFSPYTILPENYQNNKEYYGYLTNNTGYTLKDVKVSYTFDDDLDADELTLNLGGSGGPANAVVAYTTRLDAAVKTVLLDASHNTLSLERGNAFLTAEITYDTLESTGDSRKVLTASLHNYDKINAIRYVKAALKSADSDLGGSDGHPMSSSLLTRFYLASTYTYLRATTGIKVPEGNAANELTKGDDFKVIVTTTSSSILGKFQDLSLYLRMPRGYILTDYTPPAEWSEGEYHSTSRTLENGDVLYCLEYTDDVMYDGGQHIFSFRVGPEADTATLQTSFMLPRAVYAAVGKDKLFQFNPGSYPNTVQTEEEIGWDVTGNGDMTDHLYVMKGTYVTINPLGLIAIAGFLSSEGQVGLDQDREYTCNSMGNSHLVIFNGIGSQASMSNGSVSIALHRQGDTFTYKDTSYTSQYGLLLTGPVKPQGKFWEGCSVQYSPDGTNWLPEDQVEDFVKISHIRIQSAQGQVLRAEESAYIDFPFAVDFTGNETSGKAYIDTEMQYTLDTSTDPVTAHVLNVLTSKPVNFSGTIYQDRNYNGKQDADELTNDKAFSLQLYSGEGTDGALLQEISTDAADGGYDFDILLPGTYTLHVAKDNNEIYGAGDYFDEHGNYTFTLNRDVPTPATKKLNMGIITQGVLEKPQFIVSPDVPDGKEDWYVTLPQITLLPMVSSKDIDTMFWHDTAPEQKLTPETTPSVSGTDTFAFRAYNKTVSDTGILTAISDIATLDLKVDVDAPVIKEYFFDSITGMPGRSAKGNVFHKALEVTVMAEDVGSGIDALYYTLSDGQVQSVQPGDDGYFRFEIAMDTAESTAFYVEDKAGNTSDEISLRKREQIIYVAADTGSDVTGDGSRTYPVQTLEAAFERVAPGGMVVLLENYNSTAYVNMEVTVDLNGKVLHANVPGSVVTVASSGRLSIMDSNGLASEAEGFERDPESEGEVFGGIPGDPAFTLDGGSLCLTDGTIYCGYTGTGNIEIMDDARMMYLLTYLNGGGTGMPPGLHYIEENTLDALKQNTFSREGYTFQGWLYEDHLYDAGQKILMPGRNMEALAKWAKTQTPSTDFSTSDPEPTEETRTLDQVPKTGSGERGHSSTSQPERMALYIEIRKKEDGQDTED